VYTARDAAGNVGRCEFDLFVAPNHCALPEYKNDDHGWMNLTSPLDGVGSAYAAWVSCDDPHFPLPGPQFYTCDVLGQWHRSVMAPAITLPVCGITDDPLQTVRLTK
ncbi:hypothetical protein PENTCL1PPCAC_9787, partial [Pristionchus entomophagus]